MSESLLTSRSGPDGGILILTLNRPTVRNALDAGLLAELSAALRQAEADPGAQVVILTGDTIAARRGAELGLVNAVVPAGQVLDAATDLAARIAANAPLALAMTKKLIRERRRGTPEESDAVFRSADAREGATAFAEKRRPAWTGK
jgi:enoyl-CoA hydratase/carnithine racemase